MPDDNTSETETAPYDGPDADTEDTEDADTQYRMSLHDRVVIGLALAVALVLCILLGTVLRVPGN
ncbi:hypothetical protein [Enterobacter asburiae]|uniref:hypothetical protein n=1 Tax=Enterobacter asburiae TaxID=61645 RepID=UPI000F864DAC|nr:hypothetical protein [Enterobacter asburiae]RTP87911.1 hypothetical protein EKN34_13385 [Enterobacter asburiae]